MFGITYYVFLFAAGFKTTLTTLRLSMFGITYYVFLFAAGFIMELNKLPLCKRQLQRLVWIWLRLFIKVGLASVELC
jgi:hypothetical protein